MRPEKIQIFTNKRITREEILDEEQKKKEWFARLMAKREIEN